MAVHRLSRFIRVQPLGAYDTNPVTQTSGLPTPNPSYEIETRGARYCMFIHTLEAVAPIDSLQ